jgi:hypothetical protein
VKKAFGEGGEEKQNMMQMIHSVYDMQMSMEFTEFQNLFKLARGDIEKFLELPDTITVDGDDQPPENKTFEERQKRIRSFRNFKTSDHEEGDSPKIQNPVLTRWWYVGVAALYLFENYLVIARLTQIIINQFGSTSVAAVAAVVACAVISHSSGGRTISSYLSCWLLCIAARVLFILLVVIMYKFVYCCCCCCCCVECRWSMCRSFLGAPERNNYLAL